MYKKLLTVSILIIISLFLFSSCIVWEPTPYRFNYDELKEQIISIELISYDNDNSQQIKDKSLALPFDFDKMDIVEVLDSSQIDKFIDDFSNVGLMLTNYFYDSPTGINLKLTYKCGDFILLSSLIKDKGYFNFIAIYDSEGLVKDLISDFRSREIYVNLINKYFETQIA